MTITKFKYLVAAILEIIGYGGLIIFVDWKIALFVFFIHWGVNISNSIKK